jgi:hypothetical protein
VRESANSVKNNKPWRSDGFTSRARRVGHVKCVDYIGVQCILAYEDFSELEK